MEPCSDTFNVNYTVTDSSTLCTDTAELTVNHFGKSGANRRNVYKMETSLMLINMYTYVHSHYQEICQQPVTVIK